MRIIVAICLLFLQGGILSNAQSPDFSSAVIYTPQSKNDEAKFPLQVLQQEIKKRTAIEWKQVNKLPPNSNTVIIIVAGSDVTKLPSAIQSQLISEKPITEEGFQLLLFKDLRTIIIAGKNKRSLLYGVGWLLRKSEMRTNKVFIPANISITTSPQFPIRGHQLGYRPKTNSYDAFSVEQFDQYIRELAFFGANSIEIVPPRTDDDPLSRHMKLPPLKMISEQSRICKKYGLNVWMWYPNMGPDYQNPDSIASELKERKEVFAAIPQLDNLFVPGGDPGDLTPGILFNWLNKVAKVLHEYHPKAKIWVSPQVFRPTQKWSEDFYTEVNKKYPWFGGVVFGPWINTPIREIRSKTNASIPIRMYPDITHSLSSQYPVPDWDLAYAMTLGRECINPRPYAEKQIQNVFARYGTGSISYSEGTNDDVNKFVWSAQDWDTTTPVIETLRDYARLFIGPDYTEPVAQGIVNLEKNFAGPLLVNQNVDFTLQQWQNIEKQASQDVFKNFRFQMCLLRAYYDAFIRQRLIYETAKEQEAKNVLKNATVTGSEVAITNARRILTATTSGLSVNLNYREKCLALADSLFKSIGAQLKVIPYGATDGRGNFLDNIDVPLNDSPWILDQLIKIGELTSESERIQAIGKMLHRTDPGPGGFYDDFGLPAHKKRVVNKVTWEDDPGGIISPSVSFGVGTKDDEWVHEIRPQGFGGQTVPKAWMTQINTLYYQPLQIEYDGLDTVVEYKIRIAYTGRFRSKMKLTANNILIHDYLQTGDQPVYEFDIPKEATISGKVIFTWMCGEGEQGSQISEIWLMRK